MRATSTWSDSEPDSEPSSPGINTTSTTTNSNDHSAGANEPPPEFTEAQVDDLMLRMLSPTNGVPTGRNVYHLRVYEQSFPGAHLVNWLAEYYPQMSRGMLTGIGQMLLNRGVLVPIKQDSKSFRDSKTAIFRFKVLGNAAFITRSNPQIV